MKANLSFPLGRVVSTVGALAALEKVGKAPIDYIQRHARGDWGDALCADDKQANGDAFKHGARLLSAYHLPDARTLWIISEGTVPETGKPYAVTTLLLPEEY